MPHPMFTAMVREMEPIRAERMLDAATAALAPHHKQTWWDDLLARARGVAVDLVKRAEPLFSFNGRAVNSSAALRHEFGQHVSGGGVES
jgi:hypothetical protein